MRKLISFLLVILAGCDFIGGTGSGTDITGTDGLTLKLGTIPGTIYLGQSFTIPITLENVGTTDIEDAILSISGYDENFIHLDGPPRIERINLFGRTSFSPTGERTTKIFRVSSISLPQDKDQITQVFQIRACYKYKTIANPVVCINPRLVQGESFQQGTCNFNEVRLTSSQGAPIAVTRVEALPYNNEPYIDFLIDIKDVSGKGRSILEDSYAKSCIGNQVISINEGDVMKIEASLSGQRIPCYPITRNEEEIDSFVIQESGPSVVCRATIDQESEAYTTVLSIQLNYGYVTRGQVFSVTLKDPARPGT